MDRTVKMKMKRKYDSPSRRQQAAATRRSVLDAACRLFVERGYASTTVAAVAREAGVSPETIYTSLGGKRGLLEGVIDMQILGPEGPIPFEQQQAWEAIQAFPTPRERLCAFVRFVCVTLARTSPVHAVIRGAADDEPFAVTLRERLLKERLGRMELRVRADLKGALRRGLTVRRAAEQLGALLSPEVYHLLTVEMGWSPDQYRKWAESLAEADLLRPRGSRAR